jgi:hypothetical protein
MLNDPVLCKGAEAYSGALQILEQMIEYCEFNGCFFYKVYRSILHPTVGNADRLHCLAMLIQMMFLLTKMFVEMSK